MKYDPKKHCRRSIRLNGYDYSQAGFYFITIVTQNRACLFGKIADGAACLNDIGKITRREWVRLPKRFHNMRLDAIVIMPNHIHGIIEIRDSIGSTHQKMNRNSTGAESLTSVGEARAARSASTLSQRPTEPSPGSLGAIIGQLKSRVTKRLRRPVWQRGYYEHIIWDDDSLDRIRRYIEANPSNWMADEQNPRRGNPPWVGGDPP